ncbi:hypothetical protein CTAYLR_005616 [Chrysophaeum taylorii]|uniref:Uncharacterized protein n=1 Tax=Chrysophaeum taylorii TaxID=2483200 RepID=A0AAD7U9I9_9STRA|nr:hypothetical protein CTAYLR_005616 [Chrysophaeum taylorii]
MRPRFVVVRVVARRETTLASPLVYRTVGGEVSSRLPSDGNRTDRPLAVVLGWTNSSIKVLSKYAALYAKHDCDAVMLPSPPRVVYRPSKGYEMMSAVAAALMSPELSKRPLCIAGFSVGAYLYGHLIQYLESNSQAKASIVPRLRAVVLDSPVDFEGVPRGLSKSVLNFEGVPAALSSDSTVPQKALQAMIEGYLYVFSDISRRYLSVSKTFHEHPYEVPSLWIYSDRDFTASEENIQNVASKWSKRYPDLVEKKKFEGTKHVSHFPAFPGLYEQTIDTFLTQRTSLASPE